MTTAEAKASEVAALNAALASLGDCEATWWSYSVSLGTFQLLVGEATGSRNIGIALMDCDYVSGPTKWRLQKLKVIFTATAREWSFKVEDSAAKFVAQGGVLWWRENFDILNDGGVIRRPNVNERPS